MADDIPLVYEPVTVAHPGETVMDYLESMGWSQRDLVRRTGITPKTISEICNSKAPITPPTALAFEKAFQRPAHLWLNLQRMYDEAEARKRAKAKLPDWMDWASSFPISDMVKLGWLDAAPARETAAEDLLTFFGVSTPDNWKAVWQASEVAFRQTRKFTKSIEAVSAWSRATELLGLQIETAPFNEAAFKASLGRLRELSKLRVDEGIEQARLICAQAGIALVIAPELPKMGMSGCARWLSDSKAVIAITLRFKSDDQMWFTFFHECGHILLHRKRHRFVLDNADEDLSDKVVDPEMQRIEEEANRFAADTLIPPAALSDFIDSNKFDNDSIHAFAESLGIGPGIVVGRLQNEGLLERHQGNALKQKIHWEIRGQDAP